MSFKPYQYYLKALPTLKEGNYIYLQTTRNWYIIIGVRRFRTEESLSVGADETTTVQFNAQGGYDYLAGALDTGLIVQLKYIATDLSATPPTVVPKWGTEPLFSERKAISLTNVIAPLDNPIELDRWSLNQDMYIKLEIDNTGGSATSFHIYLDAVEYKVAQRPPKKLPPRFVTVTSNGFPIYIETEYTEPFAVRKV